MSETADTPTPLAKLTPRARLLHRIEALRRQRGVVAQLEREVAEQEMLRKKVRLEIEAENRRKSLSQKDSENLSRVDTRHTDIQDRLNELRFQLALDQAEAEELRWLVHVEVLDIQGEFVLEDGITPAAFSPDVPGPRAVRG